MSSDHATSAVTSHRVLALPEILDAVFSHLHLPLKWDIDSDRAHLRACILVNHVWSSVARPHLWSALSFKVITPGAVDDYGISLAPSSLDNLQEFLTSSPVIRRAVRSLRLIAHYGQPTDDLSATTLYSIFCVLPALQHVYLDAICQRLVGPLDVQHHLSVRSIELRGDNRHGSGLAESLLILVAMFSDIGELGFADYWLGWLRDLEPSPRPTRIGKIDITAPHNALDRVSGTGDPHTEGAILAIGSEHRTDIGVRLNDAYSDASYSMIPDTWIHERILPKCRSLRRARFVFERWLVDIRMFIRQRHGWELLVACINVLPNTVDTILVDFTHGGKRPDFTIMGAGRQSKFTDGLPHVEDLMQKFEEAVLERPHPLRVCMVPGGKPVFSLREQDELRAFFPGLSASGRLKF